MDTKICYTPLKGVDDVIAKQVNGWNSHYVANLRGLYKERTGEDTEDVNTLIEFNKTLTREEARKLADVIKNPIIAYDQLREAFTTQERVDRTNLLASLFSDVVDSIQDEHPELEREDIIKGYIDSEGKFQYGAAEIYKKVYEILRYEHVEQALEDAETEEEEEEILDKYRAIFNNWGALITFANTIIRDIEGVKIGSNLTFADNTNITDYDEDSMIASFVADESTKEAWQEVSDSISPFGATSVYVRRVLGRLTVLPEHIEDADVDDLGYVRKLPVVTLHQVLMEVLRGMRNENNMVEILSKEAESKPYIYGILEMFKKDPILRTQFFVDFSKSFQLYSMQDEKVNKDGSIEYSNPTLNIITKKQAFKRYLASINTKLASDENTIFEYTNEGTMFNKNIAGIVSEKIIEVLGELDSEGSSIGDSIFSKFDSKNFSKQDRIDFYGLVLPALGIELTWEDYNLLASNNAKMNAINKSLKDLQVIFKKLNDGISFRDALNRKVGANSTEGFLAEKLGKIVAITDSLSNSKKILSRVRYNDNTYYSDVQSSFLGRFCDSLAYYTKNNNVKGLQDFIYRTYLENSMFLDKENSFIYNRWLREMFEEGTRDGKLASNFTYKKLLGDNNQKVDDFISRKQAINMINEYFSENSQYGWYPVFVLGDSGSSKWIKAKRYNETTIIEELYNVYRQECIFKRELKELKDGLRKAGKSLGSLENIDENKFGMLPFLNGVNIDKSNIEESVKNAIREHLESSFVLYISKLKYEGVFNKTKDDKTYKYLNKLAKYNKNGKSLKGEEAIIANLKDYFYNNKFAMVMQMQLMTINPLFYNNGSSVDLQKRYKEVGTSGNIVSTDAVNKATGEKFSDRDYQTVVYFQDVKVNPEETNPEFMEVIAYIYGKPLVPEGSSREEIIAAGKKTEIYNIYKNKTSFTDGQGYRTLKSYKAIMGMSGKWNPKCEAAYNEIENIRREIRENGGQINENQAKRLSDLLVTLQPIKPFLFTHERMELAGENSKSIFSIPVQLKYAEVVMIPELLPKGSRLRDMLEIAEDNDVDVLAATTAVKVGSFGEIYVTKASDIDEMREIFKNAVIHKLSNKDYIIQTNIPEHVQGSQLFATQCRKLIFANLKEINDEGSNIYYNHYVGNDTINLGKGQVKVNAYNLNRFYISLISANILEDFDTFKDIIRDPEKVRQALVQMTINNNRETRDNLRGYGKGLESDFLLALFEGGIEHDTAALLLSMFKKNVNKQKINGGSAVQVSAFGITGYNEDNNLKFVKDPDADNILYAEVEIPWDLSYTDQKGNKTDLKFENWCNPDGTLKLGEVLSKEDSRYKDYMSYTNEKGEVCIPLIEKEYPGILSFIAYRIPTEAKYSMINCKVKRFSLKVNGGGTIKVPAQGTSIAGFDFDIDKLYFMRREFKEGKSIFESVELSKEDKDRIREKIKEMYPELLSTAPAIEESTFNQSQLYEIFNYIYKAYPSIYEELKSIRSTKETPDKNGKYKTSLNSYFTESNKAKELVEKGGFEDVKELKNFLVTTAAEELGFIPETITIRRESYEYLDNDKIEDAGLTKGKIFREAAKELGIQVSITKSTLDTYDFTKPAWDASQSRVARNNMLINMIQRRLEDPQTIEDRTTPGGFETIRKAARYIQRLLGIENKEYDYTDPWTMITYTQQNQVAGKLIGIFANQNTNQAIASLMKEFKLKESIAFGDHPYGLNDLLNPKALTKELLAASVDAVKDPVLNFLNLNTITADSAGMLCRLGYSFEEIGLLMNQPIIKELCNECMDLGMADVDTMIDNILNNRGYKGEYDKLSSSSLTVEVLEKGLTTPENMRNAEFDKIQIQSLLLFKKIYANAKEVGEFVTNTKFTASNAVKSTFGGMYAQRDKVVKYINSFQGDKMLNLKVSDYVDTPLSLDFDISDKESYIMDILNNPFGYEQVMYDANVNAIKELCKYYPYDNTTYTNVRNFMNDLTKGGLNEDTINDIHEYMLQYMIENCDDFSKFNPNMAVNLDNGEIVSAKHYYTKYIPLKISKLLSEHKELRQLPIFQYLITEEDPKTKNTIIRIMDAGALTSTQKDEIRDSWESLLDNPDLAKVAEDLYMYSYYMSGFGFGVIGFNHLAPLELKLRILLNEGGEGENSLSYIEFLNNVLKDKYQVNLRSFAIKFITTHKDNKRLVYEPKSNQKTFIKGKIYENGNIPASKIILDASGSDKGKIKPFILRTTKTSIHFKPAILVDGKLYIVSSSNAYFNQSQDGKIEYVLVKEEDYASPSYSEISGYNYDTEEMYDSEDDFQSEEEETMKSPLEEEIENDNSTSDIEGDPVVTVDWNLDLKDITKKIVELNKEELEKVGINTNDVYENMLTKMYEMISNREKTEEDLKKEAFERLINDYKEQGVKCKVTNKPVC